MVNLEAIPGKDIKATLIGTDIITGVQPMAGEASAEAWAGPAVSAIGNRKRVPNPSWSLEPLLFLRKMPNGDFKKKAYF